MAKTILEFKTKEGTRIVLEQGLVVYLVLTYKKGRLFKGKPASSFSFGRLSHAISKYWDLMGDYLEQELTKAGEKGN